MQTVWISDNKNKGHKSLRNKKPHTKIEAALIEFRMVQRGAKEEHKPVCISSQ